MNSEKKWKSYITSDSNIPQRIQNMIIREYYNDNNIPFSLSATELNGCNNIVLETITEDSHNFDAVILYSINSLPNSVKKSKDICEKILNNGTELHFAYEKIVIKDPDNIQQIEDIVLTKKIAMEGQNVRS
ncbi:MAG: hypothetical protein BM556_03360 [Bacteriovorax sp. MedPE-SWde]|nr:MAG: hypothetical protein BM556_03360 [Bacteriovorax sp. MedPE-SWde]